MKTPITNQNGIIQIKLFNYETFTANEFIRVAGFSLGMALLIGITSYCYLDTHIALVPISLSIITVLIAVVGLLSNHLFPDADLILIIAYEEFKLMDNTKILSYSKITDLVFEKQIHPSSNISILTIKGLGHSEILITHGSMKIKKPSISCAKINYVVNSGTDWQTLLKYT